VSVYIRVLYMCGMCVQYVHLSEWECMCLYLNVGVCVSVYMYRSGYVDEDMEVLYLCVRRVDAMCRVCPYVCMSNMCMCVYVACMRVYVNVYV